MWKIVLTRDDLEEMARLKKGLSLEFEIKDLSELHYFLGMKVARMRQGIGVSQRKFMLNLLEEKGMLIVNQQTHHLIQIKNLEKSRREFL